MTARDRTARSVRPTLVLLLTCVAQFMLLVDDTIVNVALPTVATDLGFSESSLSWVVNAYLLTFGGFLLIGGRLADRFGPRRLFVASLGGFALASALCGLAPSAEVLVTARAVQGLTAALLSPAALAILLLSHPAGAGRRRAVSAWAALTGVGAAFGLLAGGVLVETADWRWIFLVNVPIAALAMLAVPRILPADDIRGARDTPNVTGAALATVALLLFVFTVVDTRDHGWASTRSLTGFVVAVALAAAFAVSERDSASPLLPPTLIGRRRAMLANAVVFVAAGGLLAMFLLQTLYLQRVLELSALRTGLAFLPFSAAVGVASVAVGRLPEGLDARASIVGGLLSVAAGLWLMSTLGVTSGYASDVLPALLLVGVGMGAGFAPLIGLATGDAEERDGGLASGLVTSAQQIGGAVGIAVLITIATAHTADATAAGAGPTVALTDGFAAAFRVQAGVILAAATLAAAMLGSRGRARAQGPSTPKSPDLEVGAGAGDDDAVGPAADATGEDAGAADSTAALPAEPVSTPNSPDERAEPRVEASR